MTQTNSNAIVGNARVDLATVIRPRVKVGPRIEHNREAKISLNKNGTTIESIHITCACGEEIVVQCMYSDVTE